MAFRSSPRSHLVLLIMGGAGRPASARPPGVSNWVVLTIWSGSTQARYTSSRAAPKTRLIVSSLMFGLFPQFPQVIVQWATLPGDLLANLAR
jgi:hypothetical protein